MGKQEVLNVIRNSKPEIESHYAVHKLGLFGSYVRDQQGRRSDIDILDFFDPHLVGREGTI